MARTSAAGFDQGLISANGTAAIGSGLSWEGTIFRSGLGSLKIALVSGAQGNVIVLGAISEWVRFYVRVTALPAATARQLFSGTAGATEGVYLNADGTLTMKTAGGVSVGTTTTALTDTARWYMVEVRTNNTASSQVRLRIDGADEITSATASGAGTSTGQFGSRGTEADTYTAYIDDVSGDNAEFPGPGEVLILLPASDNSNTNWVRGGNTTNTDLYLGCSTIPPAGVASASETDNTNIQSSSNSGTANYVANMQSYLEVGIRQNDIVKLVFATARHGEDISTGTKTGSVQLTANPADSGATTFTFGGDAGAHGAEGESSNWRTTRGAVVADPTVTLDSAPTVKVIKTDTTTRTGCIDLLCVVVDVVRRGPPIIVPQARNRAACW